MPDLTVTLIQTELHWEDVAANLRRFDRLIGSLQVATDLIVLPEMFTTGFSMNADALAEDMNGRAVAWLRNTARHTAAAVARMEPLATCPAVPSKPWPYTIMPTGCAAVSAHSGTIATNGASYMPWYVGLPSVPRARNVFGTARPSLVRNSGAL